MEALLQSQSVAHLKKMISTWTNSHRIKGYSRMKKDELIDAMEREMTFKKKEDDEMLQDVVKRMAKATEKQLKAKAEEVAKTNTEARKKKAQEALEKYDKEQKAKAKAEIKLGGEKIKFKPDALRKQLRMRKDDKLTKPLIRKMLKVPDGGVIEPFNKRFNMTKMLRKRLQLALNMMK